jgi:hypothetical protein
VSEFPCLVGFVAGIVVGVTLMTLVARWALRTDQS